MSRAANILRLLGVETNGLSLGQIAKNVELPRSTVQRIVSALALEGLISIDSGNAGIRLGPEIQSLAHAGAAGIKDRLRPAMRRISEATGETVDLAILEGKKMRFVDQIIGSHRLRAVSSIGEAFPLTTTANGKAALAALELTQATKLILAEFEERPESARPLTEVLDELSGIQTGALALDENEHTEGISALGYAVQVPGGDIYAISVPVPSFRFHRVRDSLTRTIQSNRGLLDH
ncbi:MAG: IclR family transcriptional regulator [Pseudomonadota bacterium]